MSSIRRASASLPAPHKYPAEWFSNMIPDSDVDNAELAEMFSVDQFDRGVGQVGSWKGIDWREVGPRDDARRARVRVILSAGHCRTGLDFYHAAMHHSGQVEEYDIANVLGLVAVELDSGNMDFRWLFAAYP